MAKKSSRSSRNQRAAGPIRLQRFLAQAGLGSRRECEELILESRVQVDGKTANELGVRVDPDKQKVSVDGTRVKRDRYEYYAVNKPPGVVSTCEDPAGRLRVIDLIKTNHRVYNVGRFDKSSEGLILVTNDGELANRLTHPRYGVDKTYLVTVAGKPTPEDLAKLRKGVYLSEGRAKVSSIRIKKSRKLQSELIIVLDEGRNREIRRLLAHIGHKVQRLKRIAIGSLRLGDLPPGAHRKLERHEIESLWRSPDTRESRGRKSGGVARRKSAAKTDNAAQPTRRKKASRASQSSSAASPPDRRPAKKRTDKSASTTKGRTTTRNEKGRKRKPARRNRRSG